MLVLFRIIAKKDELAHMPNPTKWLNRATATYQLSANVAQFPYIDAELLRIHCKVSHQDKKRRRLDHVLMLEKKSIVELGCREIMK
jgi:hypothetical protein